MDAGEVRHNEADSRYEYLIDGKVVGVIDYQRRGDVINVLHTGVPTEYEGRGIAGAMTQGALDDCRARGLRVIPSCSYTAAYFRRHPEYADLRAR